MAVRAGTSLTVFGYSLLYTPSPCSSGCCCSRTATWPDYADVRNGGLSARIPCGRAGSPASATPRGRLRSVKSDAVPACAEALPVDNELPAARRPPAPSTAAPRPGLGLRPHRLRARRRAAASLTLPCPLTCSSICSSGRARSRPTPSCPAAQAASVPRRVGAPTREATVANVDAARRPAGRTGRPKVDPTAAVGMAVAGGDLPVLRDARATGRGRRLPRPAGERRRGDADRPAGSASSSLVARERTRWTGGRWRPSPANPLDVAARSAGSNAPYLTGLFVAADPVHRRADRAAVRGSRTRPPAPRSRRRSGCGGRSTPTPTGSVAGRADAGHDRGRRPVHDARSESVADGLRASLRPARGAGR